MKQNNQPAKTLLTIAVVLLTMASCDKEQKDEEMEETTVFSASGDIQSTIDEFRAVLGTPLNTAPGVTGGRREINWDGLPDELLNQTLPNDLFNPTDVEAAPALQRGLVYETGQDFRISDDGFAEVNAEAAGEFASFSGNKTFANVSSNLWDVYPQVPGEARAASVQGFGIVFSDVDEPTSVSLEFFENETSLGRFFVPPHDNSSSFSFLGVYFKTHQVTRIQVQHAGHLDAGGKDISQGGTDDLVVMDDFLYSEPVAQ